MHCHYIPYAEPYLHDHCHCCDNNNESNVDNTSALEEHINNTEVHLSELDRQKLDAVSDEVETIDLTKYYSKEEVDAKINEVKAMIANIKDTITFTPSESITNAASDVIYLIGTLTVNGQQFPIYNKVEEKILNVTKNYNCECPTEDTGETK